MPDWLTVHDVALYKDLPVSAETDDDNLVFSTATVKAAVERRRSDLWVGDPAVFTPSDEVKGGAVMWAGLVYDTRSAPSGFSGYGDETVLFDTLGGRRAEILRLVGWKRPVAI